MPIRTGKNRLSGETPTAISRVLFLCVFSLLTTASNLKGCDEDIEIGAPGGDTEPSPSPTNGASPTPTPSPGFTPTPSPTPFNPFIPNPTSTPSFNPSPTPSFNPSPTPGTNSTVESLDLDSDNDGLSDKAEREIGTDPFNPDTDNDGYSDGFEVPQGSDPLDPNSIPVF